MSSINSKGGIQWLDPKFKDKCQCDKCHSWFYMEEMISIKRNILGVIIDENVCPYCGSIGYTKEEDYEFFLKYDELNY